MLVNRQGHGDGREPPMMRKAIATIGAGPMGTVLDLSAQTFRRLAEVHGYDVVIGNGDDADERPAPWGKIRLIRRLLAYYEVVLWLDADTVVLSFDRDPVDDLPAACFQGLVQHRRDDELIPNTGVWLLRSEPRSFEFLDAVWNADEFIDDMWWENGAVIDLLGYTVRPTRPSKPSPWLDGTAWLDDTWNKHIKISGLVPARVRHYVGQSNWYRVKRMKIDLAGLEAAEARGSMRMRAQVRHAARAFAWPIMVHARQLRSDLRKRAGSD
jgi:hypothetical protein